MLTDLEIRQIETLQIPDIDVGRHHVSARADLLGQPDSDRPASGSDLQTPPARLHQRASSARSRIENVFQQGQSLVFGAFAAARRQTVSGSAAIIAAVGSFSELSHARPPPPGWSSWIRRNAKGPTTDPRDRPAPGRASGDRSCPLVVMSRSKIRTYGRSSAKAKAKASRTAPSLRRVDAHRRGGNRASSGTPVRSPPGGPSGTGRSSCLTRGVGRTIASDGLHRPR